MTGFWTIIVRTMTLTRSGVTQHFTTTIEIKDAKMFDRPPTICASHLNLARRLVAKDLQFAEPGLAPDRVCVAFFGLAWVDEPHIGT